MRSLAAAVLLTAAVATPASGDSSASLNAQGVKAFDAGDIDSAVFYFTQALELDSESDVIRSNLSNAFDAQAVAEFEKGDRDYAVQLLERAINTSPSNAGPLIRLGFFHLQMDQNDEAIFRLEEAIQLAPDNPEAHFLLGEAYYRDNDVKSALDQWEWVHEIKPNLPGLDDRLATAKREASVEGDYDYKRSRRFNVTYNPDLRSSDVREIIRILDRAYSDIGRKMGNTYPPGPIQVTLYAADDFSKSTLMGSHIGGIFDGTRIRCPVLTQDGDLIPEEYLEQVLYHEYVHVVIKHIAPGGIPWWMNEGLAEALSHDVSDAEAQLLKQAKSAGIVYPMEQLEEHQLKKLDPEHLSLAYAEAHAATSYLIDHNGLYTVVSVIKRIDGGDTAEDALRKACGVSYETLDMALAGLIDDL